MFSLNLLARLPYIAFLSFILQRTNTSREKDHFFYSLVLSLSWFIYIHIIQLEKYILRKSMKVYNILFLLMHNKYVHYYILSICHCGSMTLDSMKKGS